jgi:hypothetical protein
MDKDLKDYLESLTTKKLNTSDKVIIAQNDPDVRRRITENNRKFRKENPLTAEQKQQINKHMRGKTLEEIIGVEAAARGRQARSVAASGKRDPAIGLKIAATRKARGSYDGRCMRGKEHKESTKATMQVKAQIRQDLRRSLNLGKAGKLPKELLEAEYKKRGL